MPRATEEDLGLWPDSRTLACTTGAVAAAVVVHQKVREMKTQDHSLTTTASAGSGGPQRDMDDVNDVSPDRYHSSSYTTNTPCFEQSPVLKLSECAFQSAGTNVAPISDTPPVLVRLSGLIAGRLNRGFCC